MVSSEVQRTLVKSPPELWAELSDPAALARHLGELGEIRIVRTEPESTIEWEGEDLTGTVSIKPSGWGTKVTLTVTRDEPEAPPDPEAVDATNEATGADGLSEATADAARADADMQPDAAITNAPPPRSAGLAASPQSETEPEASPAPAVSATGEPEASPEPAASQPDPPEPTDLAAPEEPKRSFFARLFGRRRRHRLTVQERSDREPLPSDAFAAVSEVLAPQTLLSSSPFPEAPHAPVTAAEPNAAAEDSMAAEPITADEAITADKTIAANEDGTSYKGRTASGLSAELKAAEEIAADEVTAVLTAVLDRLGAAHHRPFSRA
jgi:hypothetical protein